MFLWPLLSISEKLPEAKICCLSGESWIDSTAPVPQAVDPDEQVLPPWPTSPAPVEVGPWKPCVDDAGAGVVGDDLGPLPDAAVLRRQGGVLVLRRPAAGVVVGPPQAVPGRDLDRVEVAAGVQEVRGPARSGRPGRCPAARRRRSSGRARRSGRSRAARFLRTTPFTWSKLPPMNRREPSGAISMDWTTGGSPALAPCPRFSIFGANGSAAPKLGPGVRSRAPRKVRGVAPRLVKFPPA